MLKTVTSVLIHDNVAVELLYVDAHQAYALCCSLEGIHHLFLVGHHHDHALLEAGLRVEQWKSLTTHDLKETLEQSACCCLLPHLHPYIRA